MTTKIAALEAPRSGFGALIRSAIAAARQGFAERRTNRVLADLDDHTLYDIGLHPGQVRRTRRGMTDWVIQTQSGTSRIVFIGR